MPGSFFKTAFRFFWRNKSYTILNYLCLTFGLTCAIIGTLNINRVLGYDKFHKNYDRLYEIEANVTYFNGDRFPKEYLSASLPDQIKKNVPEVESISRVASCNFTFINGNETFSEGGIYADPVFLDIFSFPLAGGEGAGALSGNNSIVISEKLALKFFKSTDCLGKTLIVKRDSVQEGYTISGVMENVPSPSYLQFDFIIPFSRFLAGNRWSLETGATACAIWSLLSVNADRKIVNDKLKNLIKNQETTLNQELFLFPLKEKILYYYSGGRRVWREMQNIVIIGAIGFAILLIACFNFINLTIAINIRRYREAGIRKVAGAHKSTLIFQHLGETFILTLICLLTAIDLVSASIHGLNAVFRGNVQFDFSDFRIILIYAGIALFTALAAGLLPSLYLSSSNPLNVLKGNIVRGQSFSLFRQSLIVFQFAIPIVLIICMIIIKVQDSYYRNFDLGFDKNKLIIIPGSKNTDAHSESVRAELLSLPGIESVSFSSCVPARGARVSNEVGWEGKDVTQQLHFWCINTDYDYLKTVNLKMSQGRYFDKSFPSDSSCYLINDIAAGVMQYEDPVGRQLTLEGKTGRIIGVFKDFHALDLAGPYTPTIISLSKTGRNNLLVKFSSDSYSQLNEKIKNVISRYEPDNSFQPVLYSDLVERSELTTVSNLVGLAFIISILLACMGLSGLASFSAAARTKEIGIRKINGATTLSVMRLLGLKYTKWLTIATLIALPLAFLIGNFFLARFNFRTPMPVWAFAAGPAIAYLISLAAVSFQSWRAAVRNPVEALRYE